MQISQGLGRTGRKVTFKNERHLNYMAHAIGGELMRDPVMAGVMEYLCMNKRAVDREYEGKRNSLEFSFSARDISKYVGVSESKAERYVGVLKDSVLGVVSEVEPGTYMLGPMGSLCIDDIIFRKNQKTLSDIYGSQKVKKAA